MFRFKHGQDLSILNKYGFYEFAEGRWGWQNYHILDQDGFVYGAEIIVYPYTGTIEISTNCTNATSLDVRKLVSEDIKSKLNLLAMDGIIDKGWFQ